MGSRSLKFVWPQRRMVAYQGCLPSGAPNSAGAIDAPESSVRAARRVIPSEFCSIIHLSKNSHSPAPAAALRQNRGLLLSPAGPWRLQLRWPARFAPRTLLRFLATTRQSAPQPRILVASPLTSTPGFSCSLRPPPLGSGHLYAGCRSVRKQVPPELSPTLF